jgi:hypothetical protein
LANDPAMKGAVAILVSLAVPEKTVRINISVPESQLQQIDRLAEEASLTRSAYMVRASVGNVVSAARTKRTAARRSSKSRRKSKAAHV